MSTVLDNKPRPYSADIARVTKVRLQSSNCPTILKHEVNNPIDTFQPFANTNSSEKQFILDRPRTASNATKMKFSFLQNMRPMGSPLSGASVRPMSGAMNSTINFDFLNNIGKSPRGKFQDKSKIKPLKKLNIDQFHSVIYKVKQQKEILEKEINRMEQWHKDFKENDIWNTPQSAIIESIMRQNAKSNPDGSVSKYLQTEKEKEEMRSSKRLIGQRPSSSYASLNNKRSPINAKSVKDFFGPDDDGVEVIEEIIGYKNQYYNQYNSNKRKITEKVNRYVDNLENYNTLMHSTKELNNNEKRRTQDFKEPVTQEDQGKSISEIVESGEDSESSPTNAHKFGQNVRPQTSHFSQTEAKNRPFSAKMVVNTAFAPKDFAAGLSGQITPPQGMMPASIHTRPHTAKQVRVPVTGTISSGLQATGEPRQESVGSVKFIPIMMEGHKIPVEPYNQCMIKTKEMTMSSKGFGIKEERLSYSATKSSKTVQVSPSNYVLRSPSAMREQEENKFGQRRVLSGKANMKNTAGTQTPMLSPEASAPIGKLNIDGEYFHSFKENTFKVAPRTTTAGGDRKKISVLDSWTTKETKQYREML